MHPNSILVFAHPWHFTRSASLDDVVVEPLRPFADLTLQAWTPGEALDDAPPTVRAVLFFQVLPPFEWVSRQSARIVWLPMWDDVECHPPAWWAALPRQLNVVAFTSVVYRRATRAGLSCLRLTYFKNPAPLHPVTWGKTRVAMYWNRRGLLSEEFLTRYCKVLTVDTLLYRNDLDPGCDPRHSLDLPDRLGGTIVQIMPRTSTREEHWQVAQHANIVIAPRLSEGIGMVMLEAMARGCAVFAFDAPAMNEYVVHQQSGYLFRKRGAFLRLLRAAQARLHGLADRRASPTPGVDVRRQHWNEIAKLNLAALGRAARSNHLIGYNEWLDALPSYARYVLKPDGM